LRANISNMLRRVILVVLGPLPATVLILPLLLAAGFGTVIAFVEELFDPARTAADRWASATTTGQLVGWILAAAVGVVALWVAVLDDWSTARRAAPGKYFLAAGLLIGLLAAGRWLWTMALHGRYDHATWILWLIALGGPLVLGTYYFVVIMRR
jgi:hypothetical protein